MNAEIREIVGNIRTILVHCIDVGSGFSILLVSYLLFGKPAFSNYQEKSLAVVNYVSGNILKFIIFLLVSYFIGLSIKISFAYIPMPKKKRLFESRLVSITIMDSLDILKFLKQEGNNLIEEDLDSIRFKLGIIKTIGTTSLVSFLLLLVAFLIALNITLLIPIVLSVFLVVTCEMRHRKGTQYYLSYMESLKSMIPITKKTL